MFHPFRVVGFSGIAFVMLKLLYKEDESPLATLAWVERVLWAITRQFGVTKPCYR